MLADHALEHGGGSAVGSAFPLVRFLLKDPLLTVAALDDPPFRAELGDNGVDSIRLASRLVMRSLMCARGSEPEGFRSRPPAAVLRQPEGAPPGRRRCRRGWRAGRARLGRRIRGDTAGAAQPR